MRRQLARVRADEVPDVAARALARGVPRELQVPGVTARQLLAWGLGLLPVAGLMTVGISSLVRDDLDPTQLTVAIIVLGGVAVAVGGLLAWLAAPTRLAQPT